MAKPPKNVKAFSFAKELVCCGKGVCRSCGGTRYTHGPYWYAYFTRKDGTTGKVYVGSDKPGWCATWGVTDHQHATPKTGTNLKAKKKTPKTGSDDERRMLTRGATRLLAARILGVKPEVTRAILTCAFKARMKTAHPDKGGTNQSAAALNAAYAMLKPLTT